MHFCKRRTRCSFMRWLRLANRTEHTNKIVEKTAQNQIATWIKSNGKIEHCQSTSKENGKLFFLKRIAVWSSSVRYHFLAWISALFQYQKQKQNKTRTTNNNFNNRKILKNGNSNWNGPFDFIWIKRYSFKHVQSLNPIKWHSFLPNTWFSDGFQLKIEKNRFNLVSKYG